MADTDPGMEQLIALRDNDPESYAKLSAAQKMRLGYYLSNRQQDSAEEPSDNGTAA